jgi:hypothetical protein
VRGWPGEALRAPSWTSFIVDAFKSPVG